MPTGNLTLLNAMTQKMSWLEQNQEVIAQNIANADTPGYRAQSLKPVDFKALLNNSTSNLPMAASQGLARTNPKHMGLDGASPGSGQKIDEKTEKNPYEVSPVGNSVVLAEQMVKMNKNFTDHQFITSLYQKNINMLKEATKSN